MSDHSVSVSFNAFPQRELSILAAIEKLKQRNKRILILDVGCGPITILERSGLSVENCAGVVFRCRPFSFLLQKIA
jgi:hypothetical protein